MKKVALLTIHRIANCGSLLQTWATVRCVERLGCACTLVDYDYPTWHHFTTVKGDEHKGLGHVKLKWILRMIGLHGFARQINFLRGRFMVRRRTKHFFAELKLTRRFDYQSVGKVTGYDVYLTGSDQTWNPRYMGDDYSFLLDFTPDSARRISYAASFGCRALPQQYQTSYGRLLSRYAAISVREPSGVPIVRDLCGKEAVAVVDPTLLMTPTDYACLTGNRIPQGRHFVFCYVLSYVFDAGDWAIKLAAAVSQAKGISVIFYAGDPLTAKRAKAAGFDVMSGFLSVTDFLECYAKADFVITTSFHGTAFSLNFRKNFYSIINPNASADDRVVSFLERFGLSHRGVLPGSDIDKLLADLPVDYSNAERLLAEAREKSLEFLKQALGGAPTLCPKIQCTGCGACFNRCAKGAISMVADEEGFAYPKIDAGKCVGCGLCQKACPQLNPPPSHPPMGKKVYAAWAKDDAIRLASSSGGLYTVFAQEILKRGGLVNGVAYDRDFNLTHRLVDKLEELAALRGSKYVQSDIGDTYRRVEEALKAGHPVLFTSTPCQVAGLYSFLGKSYDNLITCDFVCHGVPSPAFFKAMVKEVARKKNVADPVAFRFRDDREWGFRPALIDINGEEHADGVADKFYFEAFLRGLNYRENCYQCKYASFSRVADLTIGDFWGLGTWWPFLHADMMKGVSFLLVNSKRGWSLVDAISSSVLYRELRDVRECEDNHQLYCPTARPECRNEFYMKFEECGFDGMSASGCCKGVRAVQDRTLFRWMRSRCMRIIGKACRVLASCKGG